MNILQAKLLLIVGWLLLIGMGVLVAGSVSPTRLIVLAALAVVVPVVVNHFWRAPDESMSEVIHRARH